MADSAARPQSATLAVVRAGGAVLRRPSLWVTGVVAFRRMVPDRWWSRRPFLPVPDSAMLGFRAATQYGDATHPPESEDLIAWLQWCKGENRRRRIR